MPGAQVGDDTGHFNGAFPAVVDMSVHSTQEIQYLKNLGVKVVIRYFALAKQGGSFKEKILEKDEADAILDNGLSIAVSYQFNNGSLGTFRKKRGEQDVDACLTRMEAIKMPHNAVIYFGVDAGWTGKYEQDKVTEYFNAINETVKRKGNNFIIGVYGSGLICRMLNAKGLARRFWIAGLSDAWPERPELIADGFWNMYQNALEVAVGRLRVDNDIVNPKAARIGSFHRSARGAPAVLDDEMRDARGYTVQRLVKDTDAVLLDHPGSGDGKPIADSKMVIWIRDEGDFSLIDVPTQVNQKAVFLRGYCAKDKLARIDAPTV
jgi:glycoside hydrolase-like protein